MAQSSKPKSRTGGGRKNLTLVALAGFLLVVWGFVLGVLVGRGTVPTLIPERTAKQEKAPSELKTASSETTVITPPSTTTTTVTTKPRPTTTLGFYQDLSKDVAETLPPLPPPTTLKGGSRDKGDKPSSAAKTKTQTSQTKKEEPAADSPKPAAFALQVAAFATHEEAEVEARRVAAKTEHKVRIVASQVKGKTWYRVRIGGFATRSEAKAAARTLEAAGLETLLVRANP